MEDGGVGVCATGLGGQVAGPAVVRAGPTTGLGADPLGVHEGDAFGDRQSPPVQVRLPFTVEQSPLQDAKQNAPVDVLTHVLPDGQVLWSRGLQAEVQAPPGNSGPLPQISPAPVHTVASMHPFARVVLASRFCAGQFAAGTQAPKPVQHVYPLRQSDCDVHALEQNNPLPLARRSVQTAPLGQASSAQLYVHSPPGIAVAQLEPTEQLASLVQGSPIVRTRDAVLQMPMSQTWLAPQSESFAHLPELSSLHPAKKPPNPIAASAARVRIRTVPPPRTAGKPYHKTPRPGRKLTIARPGCPW
jgi:hypothetical protein